MAYVDGFVLPVPKENLEIYKDVIKRTGELWMRHGALAYVECLGDDVPYGTLTSFPRAVMAKDDEVVVFSWIVYRSREDRDRINELVMQDDEMREQMDRVGVDGARMILGGFTTLIEL